MFHNVYFRHFGKLKLRFLLNTTFINRLCVVNMFGYICSVIENSTSQALSQYYYCEKSLYLKTVFIFICTVYSGYPLLFPHYMFSSDMLHGGCLSNLPRDIPRYYFSCGMRFRKKGFKAQLVIRLSMIRRSLLQKVL